VPELLGRLRPSNLLRKEIGLTSPAGRLWIGSRRTLELPRPSSRAFPLLLRSTLFPSAWVPRSGIMSTLAADLRIIRERDPAPVGNLEILLCIRNSTPGAASDSAPALGAGQIPLLRGCLPSWPAASPGVGSPRRQDRLRVFIDHGMGVVIGETRDRRCPLQGVTWRHGKARASVPTLGENVGGGARAQRARGISVRFEHRIGVDQLVLAAFTRRTVGIPWRVVHQFGECAFDPLAPQLPDAEARVIRQSDGAHRRSSKATQAFCATVCAVARASVQEAARHLPASGFCGIISSRRGCAVIPPPQPA